ncbi:hypothetical protein M1437_04475 [Patescibacteria group bacterium]|nr:hypothetical protein [Patescibacteria group bacterium]
MANTVLDPFSTQAKRERVPRSQVIGGIMGGIDESEFETRSETRPENSPTYREVGVSRFPLKGTIEGFHSPSRPTQEAPIIPQHEDNSIDLDSNRYLKAGGSFSNLNFAEGATQEITKVGEIASDTAKSFGEAGWSLFKDIVGIGEQTSKEATQSTQENTAATNNGTTIQPDHETALLKRKEIQVFLEQMSQKKSILEAQQAADESIRRTGRILTKEEALAEGHLDEKATSTQMDIARKESEIAEEVENQQQEESIAATNPKQFVGENDLQNREGGSQLGGVGDVSPG